MTANQPRGTKRFYLIGFSLLVLFDTLAQISFKTAALHAEPQLLSGDWLTNILSQPWIYGALVGYIGTFFTWLTLLKHAPIGPAFAASHLEIVSVTLLSVWLFNEPLTAPKIIGGLLILAGILCLAKSGTASNKKVNTQTA